MVLSIQRIPYTIHPIGISIGDNKTIPVPLKNPNIPKVIVAPTQSKKSSFLDFIYPSTSPYVPPPIPPPYNKVIIAISLLVKFLSFLCDLLQNFRKCKGGILRYILCKPNIMYIQSLLFHFNSFLCKKWYKNLHGIIQYNHE